MNKRPPQHPGIIIRHYANMFLKQGEKEFLQRSHIPNNVVAALFEGRISLTTDLAMASERALCIPARYFLDKQEDYDRYVSSSAVSLRHGITSEEDNRFLHLK